MTSRPVDHWILDKYSVPAEHREAMWNAACDLSDALGYPLEEAVMALSALLRDSQVATGRNSKEQQQ